MVKRNEKILARELYVNSGLSQKEIASRVAVRESTIGKWIADGNWDTLRTAGSITRKKLLEKAFKSLGKINDYIDEQCDGLPNKKTLDSKNAILREIATLDREESIAVTVAIMEDFSAYVMRQNINLGKQLAPLQMEYLEMKATDAQNQR